MEAQADWHVGTNISTSELDLTYQNLFHEPSNSYTQRMWIEYKDNTRSTFGFDFAFTFSPGGINATHVLNWSKVIYNGPILTSGSTLEGTIGVGIAVKFNGFIIVNGTAGDVELVLREEPNKWGYGPKNTTGMASLFYMRQESFFNSTDWNLTMKIGAVNLTTRDYSYEGRSLKESIATFNISINAVITDSFNFTHIPVVLDFRVTHNITKNTWKYGADIDWSAVKDFPCRNQLSTGDNFSLVANDALVLAINHDLTNTDGGVQLGNYTTNTENDTAIFVLDGVEYAREYFTTHYLINGTEPHNTTRIFIANATHSADNLSAYASQTFIIFDGFKYNQSLGFEFDPFVVVPCSEVHDVGIPWTGLLFQLLGVLTVVSIVFSIKKKKPQQTWVP